MKKQLNGSTDILQISKTGLAHDALEHHASSYFDIHCQCRKLGLFLTIVLGMQGCRLMRGTKAIGEGVARGTRRVKLGAALLDQLIVVITHFKLLLDLL